MAIVVDDLFLDHNTYEALDSLAGQINGWLNPEHSSRAGRHKHIHADEISIEKTVSRVGDPPDVGAATGDLTVEGDINAKQSVIFHGASAGEEAELLAGLMTGRIVNDSYPSTTTTADVTTPFLSCTDHLCPATDDAVDLGRLSDVAANSRRWKTIYFSKVVYGPNLVATTAIYERARSAGLGEWTTQAYADSRFTDGAGVDGNWGVDDADEVIKYTIEGRKMTVNVLVGSSDIANAPTQLRITIPGGHTCVGRQDTNCRISDAGGAAEIGAMWVDAATSTTKILIERLDGSAFTNTTSDNTSVVGQLMFEIGED